MVTKALSVKIRAKRRKVVVFDPKEKKAKDLEIPLV